MSEGATATPPAEKFSPFGSDLFGEPIKSATGTPSPLGQRFIMPPFTVLSARDGDWQSRKSAWAAMGIKSEVGRKDDLVFQTVQMQQYDHYRIKEGKKVLSEDAPVPMAGTSIFDPVLCELMYSWFSGPGQQVVDPFAGGSVRGVVASCLGRKYWGGELRQEQVDANREQVGKMCQEPIPEYACGCSTQTLEYCPDADFVFSCPPYGDLEVYSEKPEDLSNMKWDDFLKAYRIIIGKACAALKNDRFACFVVGDFRAKDGSCRNFVAETISAFLAGGLTLYNEAILITAVGTAAARATRQFEAGRKMVKTHQNILVFCKGDWKKATEAAGGRKVRAADIAPALPGEEE